MKQVALPLRSWGGRRRGAGRKPRGAEAGAPHEARAPIRASQPVHVTLRMARRVWNLRSERSFAVIHGALMDARNRPDFRVVHFCIQGDHLHVIAEADGTRSLANGVRALTIRLARNLNRMMGSAGSAFEDRFHAHVLRTPAEARNALRYVLGNRASHLRRLGVPTSERPDPNSSAVVRSPIAGQLELLPAPVARPARTWLLRNAVESCAVARSPLTMSAESRSTAAPGRNLPRPVRGRASRTHRAAPPAPSGRCARSVRPATLRA